MRFHPLSRRVIVKHVALLSLLLVSFGQSGANPQDAQSQAQTSQNNQARALTRQPKAFLAVTAEQLAQDFIDDPGKAYRHYGAQPVQVTGVVWKRKDPVTHIRASGKVKDGKSVEWTFVMVFPKSVTADDVVVGKKVTLRGTLAATGGGTTTIDVKTVVRDGDEKGTQLESR